MLPSLILALAVGQCPNGQCVRPFYPTPAPIVTFAQPHCTGPACFPTQPNVFVPTHPFAVPYRPFTSPASFPILPAPQPLPRIAPPTQTLPPLFLPFLIGYGEETTPPAPATPASTDDPIPGGVVGEKLSPITRYTLSGRVVGKSEAIQAVAGNDLLDDSRFHRLTVIGADGERRRVLDDLRSLPHFEGTCAIQSYAPTAWAVRDAGFVTTGRPTIYLQRSDGKVLHRQDDYDGGIQALSGAIRKADARYNPAHDPDLRKADPVPTPQPLTPAPTPNVIPAIPFLPPPWDQIVGGAIAMLLLLFRDRVASGGGSLFERLRERLRRKAELKVEPK